MAQVHCNGQRDVAFEQTRPQEVPFQGAFHSKDFKLERNALPLDANVILEFVPMDPEEVDNSDQTQDSDSQAIDDTNGLSSATISGLMQPKQELDEEVTTEPTEHLNDEAVDALNERQQELISNSNGLSKGPGRGGTFVKKRKKKGKSRWFTVTKKRVSKVPKAASCLTNGTGLEAELESEPVPDPDTETSAFIGDEVESNADATAVAISVVPVEGQVIESISKKRPGRKGVKDELIQHLLPANWRGNAGANAKKYPTRGNFQCKHCGIRMTWFRSLMRHIDWGRCSAYNNVAGGGPSTRRGSAAEQSHSGHASDQFIINPSTTSSVSSDKIESRDEEADDSLSDDAEEAPPEPRRAAKQIKQTIRLVPKRGQRSLRVVGRSQPVSSSRSTSTRTKTSLNSVNNQVNGTTPARRTFRVQPMTNRAKAVPNSSRDHVETRRVITRRSSIKQELPEELPEIGDEGEGEDQMGDEGAEEEEGSSGSATITGAPNVRGANQTQAIRMQDGTIKYICDWCGSASFNSVQGLWYHKTASCKTRRQYFGTLYFECGICTKGFLKRTMLKNHLAAHFK